MNVTIKGGVPKPMVSLLPCSDEYRLLVVVVVALEKINKQTKSSLFSYSSWKDFYPYA